MQALNWLRNAISDLKVMQQTGRLFGKWEGFFCSANDDSFHTKGLVHVTRVNIKHFRINFALVFLFVNT